MDFGPPLHSLVLAAEMHFMEREMFEHYHWDKARRTEVRAQEKAEEESRQRQRWVEESKERKAQDEQRKREVLMRKEKDLQRRAAEQAEHTKRHAAEHARHSFEDDDADDGVELEPLF